MKHLSRAEELILLAVLRLGKEAYCVSIYDFIHDISGKKWTLGSIYPPLYRLEKQGFLDSYLGDPTAERGGKSKRFYSVTRKGLLALQEIKRIHEASWEGMSSLVGNHD